MISPEFVGIFMILGVFVLILLVMFLSKMFWKYQSQYDCDYCGALLDNCKIIVNNEGKSNVYCSSYCTNQGLKRDEES